MIPFKPTLETRAKLTDSSINVMLNSLPSPLAFDQVLISLFWVTRARIVHLFRRRTRNKAQHEVSFVPFPSSPFDRLDTN
jgi:hypothetical protein